jgi:hypothetical protein
MSKMSSFKHRSLLGASALLVASSAVAQTPVLTNVSGLDPTTQGAGQSEAAATVSVLATSEVEVIAANDDVVDSGFVYPDAVSRRVFEGASLMGWYFRERTATDPNPAWQHGRLLPGVGAARDAAVIWGDPGVAAAPEAPGLVLQGSLMVPRAKFPDGTLPESTCVTPAGNVGCIINSVAGDCSPLGGACVARSTDGGKTFTMLSCFSDKTPGSCTGGARTDSTNGHFYDGMDLAVGLGADPAAYVAMIDTDASKEALWTYPNAASASETDITQVVDGMGPMGQLGSPLGNLTTHLRLRVDSTGRLWRLSRDLRTTATVTGTTVVANDLKVNILGRNAAPVVLTTSHALLNAVSVTGIPNAAHDPNGQLAASLRFGPQFDFDVGKNEAGQDEMRFIFIASGSDDSGTSFVWMQGGFCNMDLSSCTTPPAWRSAINQQATQFHPTIKYGFDPRTGRHHWKVSYYELNANRTQVAVLAGNFKRDVASNTAERLNAVAVTPLQTPCPDERGTITTTGALTQVSQADDYWGDYDDMLFNSRRCSFLRPFTDSSQGCTSRTRFSAQHQHLSAVELPCEDTDAFRKVSMSFRVFVNDDDFGDPDECETYGFERSGCAFDPVVPTAECLVSPLEPEQNKQIFSECVDDEVKGRVLLNCKLNPDQRSVHVSVTPIVNEGTDCDGPEVARITAERDVPPGGTAGDFIARAEVIFEPTNGSPYDRCEVGVAPGAIVNGTQF